MKYLRIHIVSGEGDVRVRIKKEVTYTEGKDEKTRWDEEIDGTLPVGYDNTWGEFDNISNKYRG